MFQEQTVTVVIYVVGGICDGRSVRVSVSVYMYICVCVCVCVCDQGHVMGACTIELLKAIRI